MWYESSGTPGRRRGFGWCGFTGPRAPVHTLAWHWSHGMSFLRLICARKDRECPVGVPAEHLLVHLEPEPVRRKCATPHHLHTALVLPPGSTIPIASAAAACPPPEPVPDLPMPLAPRPPPPAPPPRPPLGPLPPALRERSTARPAQRHATAVTDLPAISRPPFQSFWAASTSVDDGFAPSHSHWRLPTRRLERRDDVLIGQREAVYNSSAIARRYVGHTKLCVLQHLPAEDQRGLLFLGSRDPGRPIWVP